jgi:hypothetical protein
MSGYGCRQRYRMSLTLSPCHVQACQPKLLWNGSWPDRPSHPKL